MSVSVNRLDVTWWDHLVAIGDNHAINTHSGCFYGWAMICAGDATGNGRSVVSTPSCENPYHADIRLPSSILDCRDEWREHAFKLASKTKWCDREVAAGSFNVEEVETQT